MKTKLKKPRLTQRVVRGLNHIYPVLDALLCTPSMRDFQDCSDSEIDDALRALSWIGGIAYWHEQRQRK